MRAHAYGSSPANQRIEGWWSYLRKSWSSWWMNFFKDLVEQGVLSTSNMLQTECLWFSFSQLLQKELEEVQHQWNTHYIRRSRHDTVPGRPDELYFLPENVNAANHAHAIGEDKYQDMLDYCHDYHEESPIRNTSLIYFLIVVMSNQTLGMMHFHYTRTF